MPASADRSAKDASSPAGGSSSPGSSTASGQAGGLGDPELRRFLLEYVKKRVPKADADDVVQTVLLDALAAAKRPEDPAELRKWVVGIARHKCADVHRRAGRERPADDELPEQPAAPPAIEERSLVRWAEEQAQSSREAGKTLDWMAREGEGDKLEHIAEEEQLPPARVRQRVSRMRRFLKERWLAEVALVAALGVMALVVWAVLRKDDEPIVADPTKPPPSSKGPELPELERMARGRRIRVGALEVCRSGDDQRCLDDLDRAKELDPEGDDVPEVRDAREKAAGNLQRKQAPQQKLDDSNAPAPTNSIDDGQKTKEPNEKPQPEPTKASPRPQETFTPKAPPKAPTKPSPNFDKKSDAFIDEPDSKVQAPPAQPSAVAPTPLPEFKDSKDGPVKAPPPAPKGPTKGGKSSAKPTFTDSTPSQAPQPPPQQMQMKK